MKIIAVLLWFLVLNLSSEAIARVTPLESQLNKISDPVKKEKVIKADKMLNEINQKLCQRFDEDIAKITAILEEIKRREGVTETVIAYGQSDTQLEMAAYWVNYAAEAVAFQKIQDYTPQITESNEAGAISISSSNLRSSLNTLQQKIIRAKNEVRKAIK